MCKVLESFGFDYKWIRWVEACISSPMFAVLVNGDNSDWFASSRGLRQRDPLSLYLFIIGMEVLVRSIKVSAGEGKLSGFLPI